jgi:hypothetical protein
MGLISEELVEARLGRALTTSETTLFETLNLSIQSQVERMLGVPVEEVSPSTRVYNGGSQHLPIDLVTDVTRIEYIDDDSLNYSDFDSSDYVLEPTSRTLKNMIINRSGSYRGINNVRVTGKFSTYGDAGVTAIVKMAILDMLVQYFNDNGNNVQKETIEGYSVEYGNFKETDNMKALRGLGGSILA